jgi:hypothetical protein
LEKCPPLAEPGQYATLNTAESYFELNWPTTPNELNTRTETELAHFSVVTLLFGTGFILVL